MVRFSARILIEVLAAVVAGVLLVGALGIWRLSQPEPVRLSFLTPYIEQALTLPDRSLNLVVDDTLITWAGWERTFDLRVRGVHILSQTGQMLTDLPELSLTLSVRALLRGMIAPTTIEVLYPRVVLLREADGRFRFGQTLGAPPSTAEEPVTESPVIPGALAEFMAAPDYDKPSGYVRRISIVDADLQFVDRRSGLTWHAPSASIEFQRHRDGLVGHLRAAVEGLGRPARFEGDLVYEAPSRIVSIDARFAGVDAAALGLLQPELVMLAGADFTLDGRVGTRFDIDGQLDRIDFEVIGGPGRLALPDQYDRPLPIRRLSATGRLDAGLDRLVLDRASVELGETQDAASADTGSDARVGTSQGQAGNGASAAAKPGPVISLAGQATGLVTMSTSRSGELRLDARIEATGVSVAELDRYWPKEVAPNPRAWVTANMTAGEIDNLVATAKLHLPGGDPDALAIDEIAGTASAKGLTIHYLKPLPPITDAAGTASFNATSLSATFSAGHVGDIEIENGRLGLTDFEKKTQYVRIEGTARASLMAALTLLDHPRLGYASALGIDPAKTAGQTVTKLGFAFPAEDDLRFEQVDLSAESSIVGASIKSAIFGKDLDDANLSLSLDRKAMTIEGTGRFAGIPSALSWRENFVADGYESRISLQGTADAAQRAALGVDLAPIVDGPVGFNVIYTTHSEGRNEAVARFDLTPSTLDIEPMGWSKPPGVAASADLEAAIAGGQPIQMRHFTLSGPDLAATGRGALTAEGGLVAVSFDRLAIGKTLLDGVEVAWVDGRPEITVAGGQLDVEPLIAEKISLKPEPAREAPAARETGPLKIVAEHLDRVMLAPDRQIENVRILLDHDAAYWDRIEIDGTLPGGTPLTMRYGPDGAGKHQLLIASDDAGAALRVLDIFDNVRGGKLKITGEAVDSQPQRPLEGKAEIKDFRLVNQPALARLLSVATLTGLIDVLTGEGFQFDRFVSDFTKTGGRVDISLARAHGPSLGLTATGNFDHIKDTIDLKGTIVPAYSINAILGNIPIIGELIQGGPGMGLFAATYRATGKLSEPTFTVNPLAALAPGFLRSLFDIFQGGQPGKATALPEETPGQENR